VVQTVLITLSGVDRPGITHRLFTLLEGLEVRVRDIEQLVVRDQLVLASLLDVPDETPIQRLERGVAEMAQDLDLRFDIAVGAQQDEPRRRKRFQVTALSPAIAPGAIAAIARVIADAGGNIDRIHRIASYPVTAIVLEGSGSEITDLRRSLAQIAPSLGIDVAVQGAGLDRRGQHLVVLDVDSTLIQDEVIDLLADTAGVGPQVAAITERAMAGEIDFATSLRERVALLSGLPVSVLDETRGRIRLTPGARTLCRTLHGLGYRIALVSGGFHEVVDPIASELGISDVRANSLVARDGKLAGTVCDPIVDRAGKRAALEFFAEQFDIPMRRTIAIGDGANDIDMLVAAGLGVAFNAKSPARAAADASVSVPYLDSVLYLLGISREEVEDLDAICGVTTPAPALPGDDEIE
jgi:phosphoserine phosphatase